MRHNKAFKKFGRTASHRRALFRNLATALVLRESIETTVPKAKDLRRVIDRLVTSAKSDTLASRRKVYSYLLDKSAVQKLFSEIAPRFKARPGGYTRIVRTQHRVGDAAPLAIMAFVEASEAKSNKKKRKTKAVPVEAVPVEAVVA